MMPSKPIASWRSIILLIIRQNSQLPFILILLVSVYRRSSVVEGLDAGANDFIRKPVDVEELSARVCTLLRLKRNVET